MQQKISFFTLIEFAVEKKKKAESDGRSGSNACSNGSGVRPRPLPVRETLPAELFSRFSERDKRFKGGWSRQNGKKGERKSDGERKEQDERVVFFSFFPFFHFLSFDLLFPSWIERERKREPAKARECRRLEDPCLFLSLPFSVLFFPLLLLFLLTFSTNTKFKKIKK